MSATAYVMFAIGALLSTGTLAAPDAAAPTTSADADAEGTTTPTPAPEPIEPLCPTMSTHFQCDANRCLEFETIWQNDTCRQVCTKFAPTCLHRRFLCDGAPDCEDGSDEEGCQQCGVDAFPCDGQCRRKALRCDGHQHCADGGDALSCPPDPDPDQLFQCADNSTVLRAAVCDGVPDCPGGEDEARCLSGEDCRGDAFFCNGTCQRASRRCDGVAHCEDGWDEDPDRCPVNLRQRAVVDRGQGAAGLPECFDCGNGRCVAAQFKCDGVDTCGNLKDEKRCFSPVCVDGRGRNCVVTTCTADAGMPCRSGYRCGRTKWLCDGFHQCEGGVDEASCDIPPTLERVFQCRGGAVRSASSWCDGKADCPGGEDEDACDGPPPEERCRHRGNLTAPLVACGRDVGVSFITCKDGTSRSSRTRCDGVPDCPEGDDEAGCASRGDCVDGAVWCDGRCLMAGRVCDGYRDCSDGEDERHCLNHLLLRSTFFHPRVCGPDHFSCGLPDTRNRCVHKQYVCDGRRDCPNNADEVNCRECQGDSFLCDGWCVRRVAACAAERGRRCSNPTWGGGSGSGVCDGHKDCADGSDEAACKSPAACHGLFCDGECRPASARCDSHVDCASGSDEADCPGEVAVTTKVQENHKRDGTWRHIHKYTSTFNVNNTFTNVTTVMNDTVAIITTTVIPKPGQATLYIPCPMTTTTTTEPPPTTVDDFDVGANTTDIGIVSNKRGKGRGKGKGKGKGKGGKGQRQRGQERKQRKRKRKQNKQNKQQQHRDQKQRQKQKRRQERKRERAQ